MGTPLEPFFLLFLPDTLKSSGFILIVLEADMLKDSLTHYKKMQGAI
jgi:hypothetical protein